MQELAFRAPLIVGCLRQRGCQDLHPDLADDLSHIVAQSRSKVDLNPTPWPAVPHMAMWHLNVEHLFETQRLRAELEVSGGAVPDARLVFDGTDRSAFHFDRIGAARQSKRLGP